MGGETINIPGTLVDRGDSLAVEIVQRWQQQYQAKSTRREETKELQEYLYATTAETTSNRKNQSDHATHRPKLTQIYDILLSIYLDNLIPEDRFMSFEPEDRAAAEVTRQDKVISYLVTKHRKNGLRSVVTESLMDWLQKGTCNVGVEYVRETFTDSKGLTQLKYEGPRPFRVDPDDVCFNITAKSWASTPKTVRVATDLGTLEKRAREQGEDSLFRKTLNKIKQERVDLSAIRSSGTSPASTIEEIDKYHLFIPGGFGTFTEYLESGSVELLVFSGTVFDLETGELHDSKEITVVDRKWVLEIQDINTWSGHPYLFHSTWRDRLNNLLGQGPLDNIVGLQFRINHLENTRADRFDDLSFPDLILTGDAQVEYDDEGRRVFRVAEGGGVQILNEDTTVLNADLQIRAVEQDMNEYAGVPKEAAGFRTPGEKTKFEVDSLITGGTRLFLNKLVKYEQEILEPLMAAEIELARVNLGGGEDVVRMVGEDGVITFETITKDDLALKGNLVPLGSRHFKKKAVVLKEMASVLQLLSQDTEVREHVSSKKIASILGNALDQPGLVQNYIRVAERAEAQRMAASAERLLAAEDSGDDGILGGDDEETPVQ